MVQQINTYHFWTNFRVKYIPVTYYKKDVTPLLWHWRRVPFLLIHWSVISLFKFYSWTWNLFHQLMHSSSVYWTPNTAVCFNDALMFCKQQKVTVKWTCKEIYMYSFIQTNGTRVASMAFFGWGKIVKTAFLNMMFVLGNKYNGKYGDIIKWKQFPHYWPLARGIRLSPVDFSQKGQWRGASMFSLTCTWTNHWAYKWDASDLRHYHTHYDITVMMEVTHCICHANNTNLN